MFPRKTLYDNLFSCPFSFQRLPVFLDSWPPSYIFKARSVTFQISFLSLLPLPLTCLPLFLVRTLVITLGQPGNPRYFLHVKILNLITSTKSILLCELPSPQVSGIRMWTSWRVIIEPTIVPVQNMLLTSSMFSFLLKLFKSKILSPFSGMTPWLASCYYYALFQVMHHLVTIIDLMKEKYDHIFAENILTAFNCI